jgi:IS30 family transposase
LKDKIPVYYTHPYSSYERGTNENANGIIRRHLPKGTEMAQVSKRKIKDIEEYMNQLPRKILGGKTAAQAFEEEFYEVLQAA